jgi:hypothetical protein
VKFNVKMSIKNALNFLRIVNAFREYYSDEKKNKSRLVATKFHENFKEHLVKEKWQQQIYEELKLSTEKAFKFLKLYEKNGKLKLIK